MSTEDARALAGVRVVELAVAIAGPAAAGCLCDWGADVIKVEHPADKERQAYASLPGVDPSRADQVSPLFTLDSRGKRSVALDLKEPAGRRALELLVAGADVFVSNLREAALERLGLGCAELRVRYPKLIIARITGYGRHGPDAALPAYEPTAFWARSGVAEAHRSYGADRPPMLSGGVGDHSTGALCAGGVAAALFRRQRTGQGAVVDASLLRTGLYANGWATQFALSLGGAESAHEAIRSMRPYSAPRPYWGQGPLSGIYRCADGKALYVKADTKDNWRGLLRVLGRPQIGDDPRFERPGLRRADGNGPELHSQLEAAFATRPRDGWLRELEREDIVCAPFQTPEEAIKDPQVAPALVPVADSNGVTLCHTVAVPVDISDIAQQVTVPRGAVPILGEHTEEVLRECGLREDDLQAVLVRARAALEEKPIFRGRL